MNNTMSAINDMAPRIADIDEERESRAIGYRIGWNMRRLRLRRWRCLTEHQEAGWDASDRSDAALRKVGVR